jgi:hypothetical protein
MDVMDVFDENPSKEIGKLVLMAHAFTNTLHLEEGCW